MGKAKQIILNVLTVLLFHGIFWWCISYPKGIVAMSLGGTLLNLFYFILYFFVLFIIFRRNKSLFSEKVFDPYEPSVKRFGLITVGILVVIEGILSALPFAMFGTVGYVLFDLAVLAAWSIFYAVLHKKGEGIFKNRRCFIPFAVFVVCVTALCMAADAHIIFQWHMYDKYEFFSPYAMHSRQNLEFIHGLVNFGYDCILSVLFIVFHTLSVQSEPESRKNKRINKCVISVIQVVVLFVGAFLLLKVKNIIYPVSCLHETDVYFSESAVDEWNPRVYSTNEQTTLTRFNGLLVPQVVYDSITVCVYHNRTPIGEYHLEDLNPSYGSVYNGNTVIRTLDEYTVNETSFCVRYNSILCYMEGDTARSIAFREIGKQEKNAALIEMIEYLISEGDMCAFEYGYEYLSEHDSNYIMPYINRYANGEFTEAESAYISEFLYREAYFIDLAEEYLNANTEK